MILGYRRLVKLKLVVKKSLVIDGKTSITISKKYYRPAEVDLLHGCSKETREVLNWEPKVGRAEGMKITYDYFKSLSEDELYKSEHKDFKKHIKN